MARPPIPYGHGFLATASSALGAVVVAGGALALSLAVPRVADVVGVGAPIALTLSVVLVATAARTKLLGGRVGTAASLIFGAFVPAFWLLSWSSLGARGDGALAMLLAFTAVPFVLIVAVLLGPVFLRFERALGVMARFVAVPSMVMATGLVALATVRCASRPELEGYVASLPVLRVVEYGPLTLPAATVTYERHAGADDASAACEIKHGTTALYDSSQTDDMNPDESQPCGGLELRRDARLRLWTFTDRTPARKPRLTLDDRGQVRMRDSQTLARSIAPPRAWVASALIGVALAAVSLALGAMRRRAARRLPGEEAMNAGGRVTLADGTTFDLTAARALPDGPIVVEVQTPAASYRENVVPTVRVLRGGSLGDAREELEARARGSALAALVVVLLGAASLSVAAMCHLVVG